MCALSGNDALEVCAVARMHQGLLCMVLLRTSA
jgi:hypothetical protein